ncbi:hypothetical protein [Streptomyces sp. NPDC127105]
MGDAYAQVGRVRIPRRLKTGAVFAGEQDTVCFLTPTVAIESVAVTL